MTKALLAFALVAGMLTAGCSKGDDRSTGVYVLVNVAGNHLRQPSGEIDTALLAIDYLLQKLAPGDTLAAANIATASFSESDIIATMTFNQRPSVTHVQKRAFHDLFERFARSAAGSPFSDIDGGMLQAMETLNRTDAKHKTILILSNLREKPTIAARPDMFLQMAGLNVAILKPPGLQPDSRKLKLYLRRVERLRRIVEGGNARFQFLDDLQQLKAVLHPDLRANAR